MIVLHGFPFSNYYNMVKHALLFKAVPFREQRAYPFSAEIQAVSPLGKVPAITSLRGAQIAESSVILDYLEEVYPAPALYPEHPEDRAQVRQLARIAEHYLELPCRRLLPAVIANASIADETIGEVRAILDRGVAALDRLARFEPYVMGSSMTVADIVLRYALVVPRAVARLLEGDPLSGIGGLAQWEAMMAAQDISRSIDAAQRADAAPFMAHIARLRG